MAALIGIMPWLVVKLAKSSALNSILPNFHGRWFWKFNSILSGDEDIFRGIGQRSKVRWFKEAGLFEVFLPFPTITFPFLMCRFFLALNGSIIFHHRCHNFSWCGKIP